MTDIAECIPSSGTVHRGVFLCSLLAAPLIVGLGGTLFMALLLLVGSGGTLFGMLHLLSGLNVALLVVPLYGLAFGALYCGLLPESGDRSAAHAAWENVLTNH